MTISQGNEWVSGANAFAGRAHQAGQRQTGPGDPDGDADADGGLHAAGAQTCFACGAAIRDRGWVRKGQRGTRHDTCP